MNDKDLDRPAHGERETDVDFNGDSVDDVAPVDETGGTDAGAAEDGGDPNS